MGESRRRGTYEERKKLSIKRNKDDLVRELYNRDPSEDDALRAGIAPFLARMTPKTWQTRRLRLLDSLKTIHIGTSLENAKPVRVQQDEMGWYLFLCEQALDDPLCIDISQASRAIPFFVAMGQRWQHAHKIKGLDAKISEVLNRSKAAPDGLIFEILVALSYAEKEWEVELLEVRPPAKSPDIKVTKNGKSLFIECKRLLRRTSYAEQERQDFFRIWNPASKILIRKGQWVWLKGVFHSEVFSLPDDFLSKILEKKLPLKIATEVLYNGPEATISARLIDAQFVQNYVHQNKVKQHSPILNNILGGDWAPMDSAVSIIQKVRISQLIGCEIPALGGYIDDIAWAAGFTRWFDSEASIDKKAKDFISHIKEAAEQLPTDTPSIIHVAAETMEGVDIERLRTQKIFASIPEMVIDKPIMGIRVHRFQAHQTVGKLWEFDETVDSFNKDELPLIDIPKTVVVPENEELQKSAHWEL